MPVFRTCTIVCDTCPTSALGYLEGTEGDVRHPDGWRFDTSMPGPAVVRCPACAREHVFASNPFPVPVPETTPRPEIKSEP